MMMIMMLVGGWRGLGG